MNTPREWEEELSGYFPAYDPEDFDAIVTFVRTIEDKTREEEREKANISDFSAGFTFGRSVEREMVRELVEGMKERTRHFPMKSNGGNWDEWNDGYDKALSDIITALNEKEV